MIYSRTHSQRIGWTALAALCLACSPFAAANVLYSNGPIDGQNDAWTIDFGYGVADTFTLPSASIITGVDFAVWNAPGDTVNSVDWSIWNGGGPGGGGAQLAGATGSTSNVFDFTNQFGYNIFTSSFSIPNILLGTGTYWLELQNASVTNGDPAYWDMNGGPSNAWESAAGFVGAGQCPPGTYPTNDCSDTFAINGAAVPEPGSIALFGSAALILAGGLRRKLFRRTQAE